jgi:hypothetical protein
VRQQSGSSRADRSSRENQPSVIGGWIQTASGGSWRKGQGTLCVRVSRDALELQGFEWLFGRSWPGSKSG